MGRIKVFSLITISWLKNVQHFYQRLQLSRAMLQTVKTIQNHKQHFNEYFHIQVLMGFVKPGIFWWILKGIETCQSFSDHIRIDPSGTIKTHQDPQLPSIIHQVQLS